MTRKIPRSQLDAVMILPAPRSRTKVGAAILAGVFAILAVGQVGAASVFQPSIQEASR